MTAAAGEEAGGAAPVLVTGASGYVGGRLVPALLEAGCAVRCLARTPAKLDDAPWRPRVEVVAGGVGDDLSAAMADVEVAVYLVHAIGSGGAWAEREQADAASFGRQAAAHGVRRIVYLGGLGDDADQLSAHLRSRHLVGAALGAAGVPVVELRAGVVIGSGSASFEMLRYLVDLLPVMVTPRWVGTRCQPIAVADALQVLVRAVVDRTIPPGIHEIGGPDVVTYAEMMAAYADVAGLRRRRLLRVPLLTPGLSSHWVGLVTPVPVSLARELVESLVNEVVVRRPAPMGRFGVTPMPLSEAIRRSLTATRRGEVPTSFVDADLGPFLPTGTDPDWAGGTVLTDVRRATVAVAPEHLFAALGRIGGATGWYGGQLLWQLRGLLDQLVGGPGMRRGRRNPDALGVGDPVDFWRVEVVEPARLVRLRAEMVLPGEAWLDWRITDDGDGRTTIVQTAELRPRGLPGRLYWLAVAPFHRFVFPALLAGLVRDAERLALEPAPAPARPGAL